MTRYPPTSYGRAVVVQFGKEASQTRDYCFAKNAKLRAARPDPSLAKKRRLGMTAKLHHHRKAPLLAKCARNGHQTGNSTQAYFCPGGGGMVTSIIVTGPSKFSGLSNSASLPTTKTAILSLWTYLLAILATSAV